MSRPVSRLLLRIHQQQKNQTLDKLVTWFVHILEKLGKFWNLLQKFSRSWKALEWLWLWKVWKNHWELWCCSRWRRCLSLLWLPWIC